MERGQIPRGRRKKLTLAVWLTHARGQLDCPKLKSQVKDIQCSQEECENSIWNFNDEELKGCPVKKVNKQSWEYLRAFIFYNRGFLPNPGGWKDQPTKFIQAMEIIEFELIKIKEKEGKDR